MDRSVQTLSLLAVVREFLFEEPSPVFSVEAILLGFGDFSAGPVSPDFVTRAAWVPSEGLF